MSYLDLHLLATDWGVINIIKDEYRRNEVDRSSNH